ncbi:MAG: xylose isomerase [Sphingobacteriales bacterium]|nr:MAG: xylose isomerase [Sphingobacteriales bacterium]
MERRKFIRNSFLSGAAVTAAGKTFASSKNDHLLPADKPFHLNYAVHDGLFKNNAGDQFTDQIQFAYDAGFRAIEDNGFMDRPIDEQNKIGEKLTKLGMRMGVFVLNFDHWPVHTSLTSGNKEWKEKFLAACKNAVEAAKRCNAKWMTVVPGNYDRNLPADIQTANVIEVLRPACEIFEPHGLVMVLESLSDTPDLFLRRTDQAFMICKAVNSPSCKFLFDMYHMQRNEGNIIANIDTVWEETGYFQIGDNPGRKEPGTGEMNYKNIFKHIYEKGYKGILGMEHGIALPGKEGEIALIKAYREADNFL